MNRQPPGVTTDSPIGRDIDLKDEDVHLADGRRLTSRHAKEVVEEVRRSAGRPSLSGRAAHSPQIAFRVPPDIREQAVKAADAEGKTVSEYAREALEARLRRGVGGPEGS
jgi:predicted HicB family RNase H-like nuclease